MDRCIENGIEFLENQERATVTFSQGRYKSRMKKLAEEQRQRMSERLNGNSLKCQ